MYRNRFNKTQSFDKKCDQSQLVNLLSDCDSAMGISSNAAISFSIKSNAKDLVFWCKNKTKIKMKKIKHQKTNNGKPKCVIDYENLLRHEAWK